MLTRRRFSQALSLTLVVSLLAFTSPSGAEAKPIQGASSPLSQIPFSLKMVDIEVSIAAFDSAWHPVSNLGYLDCKISGWIQFTVKNKGTAIAKNFLYKVAIYDNGAKVYDPPATQLTLNSGESKSFFVKVSLPHKSDDIKATLTTGQKFDNLPPDNKIELLEVGH